MGDMQDGQGCTAAEAAPIDMAERIPQPAPRPLPPYNGFGSLEDSAQSCRSLVPQVPPRTRSAYPGFCLTACRSRTQGTHRIKSCVRRHRSNACEQEAHTRLLAVSALA